MNLNENQKQVINSIDGVWVVISGPGSGKTLCMVERFLNMIGRGIPMSQILNLTFTNSAATEAAARAGLTNATAIFRTFHSFALELIKKERAYVPFKLTESVIPVRGEEYQLLFDLVKQFPAIPSFKSLQSRLSEWKRASVEPEEAMRNAVGAEYYYALAYEEYEKKCREQGWLDFDSLMRETVKLLETNDEVRRRNKKKYLSVDECQDTDITQFRLLQLLFDGNIMVVGDENQCQPPGTLVDVLVSPAHGSIRARVKRIPIEELSATNDRLVSWDHRSKRVLIGAGRSFRRSVRHFDGNLLEIRVGNRTTKVTPNHFVWTKFNRDFLKSRTHFVYLMWKKQLGYRVGTSTLRTASGSNQISHRGYQERADKMWILDIVKSGKEARILEEIYSLKYQIPERIYQDQDAVRVFKSVPVNGGLRLLKDKGLEVDYPLVSWSGREKHITKFHGYFKTVAANLIEEVMDLPTQFSYRSEPIRKIKKIEYHGPVFSLEVEKDHTYIADRIPVGNCIYEWRSAKPGSLSNFEDNFPGAKILYLGQNYRSTKSLVKFFKQITPIDNGIASYMMTENEQGIDPVLIHYPDSDIEVRRVLDEAHKDPENSVIIARTNRKLFEVQRIATSKGIKYKNLGKKDFWEQNEVKALLALARDGSPHQNAAQGFKEIIRDHNLYNRYRHSDSMYSDPIENLNNMVKMATIKGVPMGQFLDYIRRLTYGRKSRKERDLTLATVHQAKGLEWKNVYLIGCEQGILPHKDGELAEERRIWFVGCSRAAKILHISWSGNRSMFIPEAYISSIKEYENKEVQIMQKEV